MPCSSDGYPPERPTRSELIALLCEACRSIHKKYMSKSLQAFWEEHQGIDRQRQLKEEEQKRREKLRKEGISKLTEKERKALGL